MLRSGDKSVQQRVAMSLARLAPLGSLRNIFADKQGLDVLLGVLTDVDVNQGELMSFVCCVAECTGHTAGTSDEYQVVQHVSCLSEVVASQQARM